MHTDVILTNKRRTHAQSNYTNTKLKVWFRRLLRHPRPGNRVGPFYTSRPMGETRHRLSVASQLRPLLRPQIYI